MGISPDDNQQPSASAPQVLRSILMRKTAGTIRSLDSRLEEICHFTRPDGPVLRYTFTLAELHGKIDMISGRSNSLVIIADRPGEYRGECAEFCGAQQRPAAGGPRDLPRRGLRLLPRRARHQCQQQLRAGPDPPGEPVHPAAGMLENNRGNLAGWILNPQVIKPGNKMPPHALTGEELNALLAYLERLE